MRSAAPGPNLRTAAKLSSHDGGIRHSHYLQPLNQLKLENAVVIAVATAGSKDLRQAFARVKCINLWFSVAVDVMQGIMSTGMPSTDVLLLLDWSMPPPAHHPACVFKRLHYKRTGFDTWTWQGIQMLCQEANSRLTQVTNKTAPGRRSAVYLRHLAL